MPVLRILILEIIILIIREIIIVEYGIKTLILRNLMVPIRFGGISFLALVVTVEEAFLNLEDEREYFLKKNMEERKNYQGECIALAKMAAYLPMFLLIILKLVVPFVAEGLSVHRYNFSFLI